MKNSESIIVIIIQNVRKDVLVSMCSNVNWKKYLILFKGKSKKLINQQNLITQQQKTIENPAIGYIKSSIREHPKTSHKFLKAIKEAKNVSSDKNFDSHLYSETKKVKLFR